MIFNLDADNILVPGSALRLKQALAENQADIVAFAEYHYFVSSTKLVTHIWKCRPGWLHATDLFAGHINPGPGGNFLYTKTSWSKNNGYWEYGKGLHEAWGFSLKQLMAGAKFFVLEDTYYYHRHGHDSLFVTESRNKIGELEILSQMLEPYKNKFSAEDWDYISHNPNWYHQLDKRPIRIGGEIGENGKLCLTWYGIARKIYHKITHL